MPQRLAFEVVVSMVFIGALMYAASTHSARATAPKQIRWLLHGPGIAAIAADGEASRLLDNTRPFVMTGCNVAAIPPRWSAIPFASFTSFRAIKSSLDRGALAPTVKGVMYDNEK
jgi:hypothetical protein